MIFLGLALPERFRLQNDDAEGVCGRNHEGAQQRNRPDISLAVDGFSHSHAEKNVIGSDDGLADGGCFAAVLFQLRRDQQGQGKDQKQADHGEQHGPAVEMHGQVGLIDVLKQKRGHEQPEGHFVHGTHSGAVGHPGQAHDDAHGHQQRHGDHHPQGDEETVHHFG